MDPVTDTVERTIASIAGRSHGVVTRSELLAEGLTAEQIRKRVRRGALIREHPGVYRVGHRAPSLEARYMAAVRASGHGGLLCGRAAAYLLGLIRGHPPTPEVLSPTRRRTRGVINRRSRQIDPRDATKWRGIPVTTIPRTLVELAAVLDLEDLARACHEAGVRYGTTPAHVDEVLARRWNSPGASKLRGILRGEVRVTLSVLERRFLALLRESDLPLPQTNRPAGGRRVDCRWPDRRLTVELDSYRYHSSRHAWENDRRREREARARGDEFRRYTYGDVFDEPRLMMAELRPLLSPQSGRYGQIAPER